MLFFVTSELVDLLKNPNARQNVIDFAQNLADARRRGRHIVYGNPATLATLAYIPELSESARRTYKALASKVIYKRRLFLEVCTFVRVSDCENANVSVETNGRIQIEIPVQNLANDDIFRNTILLAENLTDAELYSTVSKIMLNDNQIFGNIKLRFDAINGGGSQTPRTYKTIKLNNNRLCLCIVDGDRDHPDAQLGQNVAKPIVDDDIQSPSPYTTAKVIDVYSAESMIPPVLLKEVHREDGRDISMSSWYLELVRLASTQYWKHLPQKKGISCEKIRANDHFSNYWQADINVGSIIGTCGKWGNWNGCPNPSCDVTTKVSGSTLEAVTSYLSKNSDTPQTKAALGALPPTIKPIWASVAKLVGAWCCSGEILVVQ